MRQTIVLPIVLLASSCAPSTDISRTDHQGGAATEGMRTADGDVYQPFTLGEAKTYHKRFEESFVTWTQGGNFTRYIFLNMSEFWHQTVLNKSERPKELTVDCQDAIAHIEVVVDETETSIEEYVSNSPTDGVIVVHDGRIVFEDYPRMAPGDMHVWFSVSKTLVSTAVAILEDRGQIDVDKTIDSYIQELSGTAWEGIPIVDILGSIRVSQRHFGAFRGFSWVI